MIEVIFVTFEISKIKNYKQINVLHKTIKNTTYQTVLYNNNAKYDTFLVKK